MKAWVSRAAGGPESLTFEDLPDPAPSPGHAVVEVKACGVNFPDLLLIADRYQYRPDRPFSPGGEISGVVASVGEGVSHVKPGDRVLANLGWGGMAGKADADAYRLVKIPDMMPFDEAAAFITAYGTSYHGLKDRAGLTAGETLLILGASGGVGLAALDIGRALGARVIAACSTQEKVEYCLGRGADAGIVYGPGPRDAEDRKALARKIRQVVGDKGADVVFDAVGGGYSEPALRSIAWNGRFLVVGFATGAIPAMPLNLVLLKNCRIIGVFFGEWASRDREAYREEAQHLLKLYETGALRPAIARRYPLRDGPEALAFLASRNVMGKLVVTMH